MMRAPELGLQEQYVLLAMDVIFTIDHVAFDSKWVDIGVAATVLFELWRNGRVSLEEGRVRPRGALSVGQTDLDAVLEKLAKKEAPFKARGINSWLVWVADAGPHKAVLDGLAHKGILSKKKRKFKLALPETRKKIVERLTRVIREGDIADDHTAALVGIADASQVVEVGELAGESSENAAQVEALGRTVAPLVAAVRTAISEKKLRNSLGYFYGFGGAALASLLLGKCSS